MTSRTLPIVLVATLALGAGFTFAINALLGGSVEEAPLRAPAFDRAAGDGAGLVERADRFRTEAYPKEAGKPRLWRSEENQKSRSERRSGAGSETQTETPAVPPETPSPPAANPPANAPSSTPPAPSPQPRSSPSPGGGEDFYSTG